MRKIKPSKPLLVILSIFIVAFLMYFVEYTVNKGRSDSYNIKRLFKYSYTVKNPSNNLIKNASFWTYLPRRLSGSQRLVKVDVSHAATTSIDSDDNEKLNIIINDIPPFGSKVISISVELGISDKPNKMHGVDPNKYLKPEGNVESDNPKIVSLAQQMKAHDSKATLANIYKWINENITDSGFNERDHSALYALENRRGDCTEFMNLFLALARANNIPARGIAGYVYPESTAMQSKDYHNWVEVYLDDTWHVIDPLNKVFIEKESQYVAMRILGNIAENDNTQRFFGSDEVIRVTMN
jgi:transglutaminase-like putative cysteine protease